MYLPFKLTTLYPFGMLIFCPTASMTRPFTNRVPLLMVWSALIIRVALVKAINPGLMSKDPFTG